MKLVIAEKPSVARAIRQMLPENSGVQVTFCFGHMLELAPPDKYDERWKKWSAETLPIQVSDWKLLPKPKASDQLAKIKGLMARATEIIHAGDPDREGQLLVDEVLDHAGWKGPVKRYLANATDPENVRKAWGNLQDNAKFRNLRLSAECRQRADWLVGMNLTRAVTKRLGTGDLISIGRVQTATLALVVRRHEAIANFKPTRFFTLLGQFDLGNRKTIELKCEPDPRITEESVARNVAAQVVGKQVRIGVTESEKARLSPLPFDLHDFQVAAEKQFGWTIAHALEVLQSAYDAGLTSYPRVECKKLPPEQKGDALGIAAKLAPALKLNPQVTGMLAPKDRVYSAAKDEIHHGIVPTGRLPEQGADREMVAAWTLVSLRFLQSMLPDETYARTDITTEVQVDGRAFKFGAHGERITNPGKNWNRIDINALLPPKSKPKAKDPAPNLPEVPNGASATCTECVRKRGETTPPKLYTEASLTTDMNAVSKFVDDPRLKQVLNETSGIGTPATQAAIIETIKQRGYIEKVRGGIDATKFGIAVIHGVPPALADPGVTAAWEAALSRIEAGNYNPAEFMAKIEKMVARHLDAIKASAERGVKIKGPSDGKPKKR